MSNFYYRQLTNSNEDVLLAHYRNSNDLILAFPESVEIERIYYATHDEENWKYWVNSAGKADKTPDYYSDDFQMMLEVMRIDDKAYKKGKRHPTLEEEAKLLQEISDAGILKQLPNLKYIQINAITSLPTDKDHNFSRFRDNFVRVINKHSKQVETYKKNHSQHKLIFFVFDETSGVYFKRINDEQVAHHLYWADSVIVTAIKESGADFVIWYKPYNAYLTLNGMQNDLPKLIIYDVANMKIEAICYDTDQMVSSEE